MFLALHGGAQPQGHTLGEAARDARWILDELLPDPAVRAALGDRERAWLRAHPPRTPAHWITPGIVAVARLQQVCQDSPSPWAASGQHHWCLADVLVLDVPLSHRGAQGLWVIEPGTLSSLRQAWRERPVQARHLRSAGEQGRAQKKAPPYRGVVQGDLD